MVAVVRARLVQSQERFLGLVHGCKTWASTAFPGGEAGSWVGTGAARTQTSTYTVVSAVGGELACLTTVWAPKLSDL